MKEREEEEFKGEKEIESESLKESQREEELKRERKIERESLKESQRRSLRERHREGELERGLKRRGAIILREK